MSCNVMLKAIKISDDVKFDDMVALNDDMNETGAEELVSRILDDRHDIVKFLNGRLLFVDADEIRYGRDGYRGEVNVWACWGIHESKTLAKHLVKGQIVLRFVEEGYETWYHKLTPGEAVKVEPQF